MKTEETLNCEKQIYGITRKMGTFGCFEVTIGFFGQERVDYLTYETKRIWRAYEVKVSKSDFRSDNHNSFVGHFNYYVMPKTLFDAVKDEIPLEIGCFVVDGYRCWCIKKPKRRELGVPENVLKDSMIRSLYRDYEKFHKTSDPEYYNRLHREIAELERQRETDSKRYRDIGLDNLKLRYILREKGIDADKEIEILEKKWRHEYERDTISRQAD